MRPAAPPPNLACSEACAAARPCQGPDSGEMSARCLASASSTSSTQPPVENVDMASDMATTKSGHEMGLEASVDDMANKDSRAVHDELGCAAYQIEGLRAEVEQEVKLLRMRAREAKHDIGALHEGVRLEIEELRGFARGASQDLLDLRSQALQWKDVVQDCNADSRASTDANTMLENTGAHPEQESTVMIKPDIEDQRATTGACPKGCDETVTCAEVARNANSHGDALHVGTDSASVYVEDEDVLSKALTTDGNTAVRELQAFTSKEFNEAERTCNLDKMDTTSTLESAKNSELAKEVMVSASSDALGHSAWKSEGHSSRALHETGSTEATDTTSTLDRCAALSDLQEARQEAEPAREASSSTGANSLCSLSPTVVSIFAKESTSMTKPATGDLGATTKAYTQSCEETSTRAGVAHDPSSHGDDPHVGEDAAFDNVEGEGDPLERTTTYGNSDGRILQVSSSRELNEAENMGDFDKTGTSRSDVHQKLHEEELSATVERGDIEVIQPCKLEMTHDLVLAGEVMTGAFSDTPCPSGHKSETHSLPALHETGSTQATGTTTTSDVCTTPSEVQEARQEPKRASELPSSSEAKPVCSPSPTGIEVFAQAADIEPHNEDIQSDTTMAAGRRTIPAKLQEFEARIRERNSRFRRENEALRKENARLKAAKQWGDEAGRLSAANNKLRSGLANLALGAVRGISRRSKKNSRPRSLRRASGD